MWKLLTVRPPRCLAAVGLAALFVALSTSDAAAQTGTPRPRAIIYMKDGFAMEGYIKREGAEVEVDEYNGTPVVIAKGFFMIDDGPRRITFAQVQIERVDEQRKAAYQIEPIQHNKHFAVGNLSNNIPSIMEVVNTSGFTNDWERTLRFRGTDKMGKAVDWEVTQHVGRLTPYSLRIDTTKYFNFSSSYLTREFPPDVIASLVATHPDFADDRTLPNADRLKRRFAYAEFLAQAGHIDLAERDLQRLLEELPKEKTAIEERQRVVGEIKAREGWEETKRLALVGGQQNRALKRLDGLKKYASEEMLTKMGELKKDYETADENVKNGKRYFKDLSEAVRGEAFRDAAQQMSDELCIDNVNRLETFLGQAKQYEMFMKDGKKPPLGPTELLSLAMSSWLLGSASGETKPETALHLWATRKLILEYEKTTDMNVRQKMVEAALKDADEPALVEIASQIITNLPPAEAAVIDTKTQQVKAGKNTVYELQLPPEYRHGRHYPVLIVLHQSGETARAMLSRWRDAAADNGYILAAPEWESGTGGYTYTEREHQSVLDTIRDLRRKYRVDSDRVFLFGLREGGIMAFDVGLSHPDLFAGVSTMGAGPEKMSEVYWQNAKHLPFYVVNGDRVGKVLDKTHKQFEHWVEKHYASLWVQYKGRGSEWFGGEVPIIFEWMRVKHRAFPLTQLGTSFSTSRPTDNSFYWLTTDDVPKACWNNSATGANWQLKTPAYITAEIMEGNDIRVKAPGFDQVSVWLTRNLRGESMIDFTKPVSLRVNNAIVRNKQMVKPSLAVLLEDLYRRGDRQRVYLAKLDWKK